MTSITANVTVFAVDGTVYVLALFIIFCVSLQLFARLEARNSLKDIEPRLFPEDGGPEHGDC